MHIHKRDRFLTFFIVALAVAAIAHSVSAPLTAQAAAGVQAYSPPRTAAGHPDLQGVWRAWNLAKFDLEDHSARPKPC